MRISICIATLLAASVNAVEFRFTNKCSFTINLHGGGSKFICDIKPGATIDNNCGASLGSLGLFKHTASNEANLLEYSLSGQVWYDVSNIPPGPQFCSSYADCAAFTGKKGYNVPISVTPTKYGGKVNCKKLVVTAPDAPDAYLFPKDDKKTHDCPMNEVFDVVYCPDNNAPAPPTAQPTTRTPTTTASPKAPAPVAPTTPSPDYSTTQSPKTTTPVTPTTQTPQTETPATNAPSTTKTPSTTNTPTVVPSSTQAPTTSVPPSTYPTKVPSTPSSTPSSGNIKPWNRCGGKGYTGSNSCTLGHSCVAVNEWHSQCVPDTPQDGELATWAQCGGPGFKGNGACQPRDECVKSNDYFSQCVPKTEEH